MDAVFSQFLYDAQIVGRRYLQSTPAIFGLQKDRTYKMGCNVFRYSHTSILSPSNDDILRVMHCIYF